MLIVGDNNVAPTSCLGNPAFLTNKPPLFNENSFMSAALNWLAEYLYRLFIYNHIHISSTSAMFER